MKQSISRNELIEIIKEILREMMNEASVTGNIAGYETPNAFSGGLAKNKKMKKDLIKKLHMKLVGKIDESKDDIDNDYVNSRDNYYNLIDKGNEAIEGILDIAKEGQHPRAYEVAGQLIGQVAQTVDKLQDLQKKLKDLKELPKSANTNIKNALFVGSTNELQKMLNKKDDEKVIDGTTENKTD